MKKSVSVILSAVCGLSVILPTLHTEKVSALSVNADGYKLEYELINHEAMITKCTGNGKSLKIPVSVEDGIITTIKAEAFSGLKNLETIEFPDSIMYIKDNAFSKCENLKTAVIGGSVEEIGAYAFSVCPKLEKFEVNPTNKNFISVSGMLCTIDGKTLVSYAGKSEAKIPSGTENIAKSAFFGRTDITSVSIPNTVNAIGDYAFSGCMMLKNIKVPDSVKTIGHGCFMNCTALSKAVLSSQLTAVPDECFSVCTALSEVNISEAVTSVGSRAFFGCGKLSGIEIPKSVTQIGSEAIGIRYNIRTGKNEPYQNFYISGTQGSQAEKYAKSAGVDFVDFAKIRKGDVDRSGTVDSIDASLVLTEYAAVAVGKSPAFNAYQTAAGDYNSDGNADAVDASMILTEYARNATK